MTAIRKFGLIGKKLTHSFSPAYFADKFQHEHIVDAEYKAYPIARIEDITGLFDMGLTGLNVTIPYKESVLPFLDELSEEAKQIGAVNTILFNRGRSKGYNTDIDGFRDSLVHFIADEIPEKAMILGSGGASKAVEYALHQLHISYTIVSRKESFKNYHELDEATMAEHLLIINTTPLGMYPNIDQCPAIPYEFLHPKHKLYDLVYNPKKTLFLIKGEQSGCRIKNGMEMLILQAEKAWQIWNKKQG